MSRPAVFVDRDGTLNRDCPYCHDPKDLFVYTDTIKLVKEYADEGYLVLIVSNQSGVNRGYFTRSELDAFNRALVEEAESLGLHIDDIFICPHRPDENCNCRKPSVGMIEQAMDKYDIDLSRSVLVGDRDDMDGEVARKMGMKYIQVLH